MVSEVFTVANKNNIDIFSFSDDEKPRNESFDLNSFSSSETDNRRKKRKRKKAGKQIVLKIILTSFLIGLITVSLVIGSFLFYVPQ